jgi:dTDP-glucose 4,6-dehydratase
MSNKYTPRDSLPLRTLVLGARGTVGRTLVRELASRGHTLTLADKGLYSSPNYYKCDITQYRQLEHVFLENKIDCIYNLAAEFGRWNGEMFYENMWMTNVIGFKHLLRLQEQYKFQLIHFSSSEVYGDYADVMSEDVLDKYEIRQLNDYAISKWVNELQILNSAAMYGTETVRVRLFNTYGPGEYYSPQRSAICIFCYRALHDLPYTIYLGHRRTSTYVTDTCETLANIVGNFKSGEVYNIGGTELHDMRTVSDTILKILGKDDRLVTYKESEPFTTKDKVVDVSKAVRDLGHCPKVGLEEGIAKTLDWMKKIYLSEGEAVSEI